MAGRETGLNLCLVKSPPKLLQHTFTYFEVGFLDEPPAPDEGFEMGKKAAATGQEAVLPTTMCHPQFRLVR